MKILHTSDWHLGHTLYNYDRTEEQMAMLLQMVDIVRAIMTAARSMTYSERLGKR